MKDFKAKVVDVCVHAFKYTILASEISREHMARMSLHEISQFEWQPQILAFVTDNKMFLLRTADIKTLHWESIL